MKTPSLKSRIQHIIPSLGYGALCGLLTGTTIFFFKFAAKHLEHISRFLYETAKESPLYIVLTFAILALFARGMILLHRKIPEVKGGGIPRSEGILRGRLDCRPVKTLIGTLIGSMMSFLCGLPLGSEGPAVLIGTSLGKICSSSPGHLPWSRYVMTGGAGAGFAVATGAPLSAMLFALEEIHKRFTPLLILTVSTSVLSATYVNQLLCMLFDTEPHMLSIGQLAHFSLSDTGYLVLFGIILSLAVALFDASIEHFSKLTQRIERYFSKALRLLLLFLLTGAVGLFFANGIYSGHEIIIETILHRQSVHILIILLLLRTVMMLLVTDSGATGGIFIPTLAIGALCAAVIAKFLIVLGLPETLLPITILLGMCAFLGGTLRAPLTAAVLFVELSGQFTDLFFVALVIFIVNFITELFNRQPFYDSVLESIEKDQNKGKKANIAYFRIKVSLNAFVVGKAVRDVMWPASSVVVSITREGRDRDDLDNDGEKRLHVGDTLIIRAKFFDEELLKNNLAAFVGPDFPIEVVEN